jgi:hypothetical protein
LNNPGFIEIFEPSIAPPPPPGVPPPVPFCPPVMLVAFPGGAVIISEPIEIFELPPEFTEIMSAPVSLYAVPNKKAIKITIIDKITK